MDIMRVSGWRALLLVPGPFSTVVDSLSPPTISERDFQTVFAIAVTESSFC